MQRSQQRVFALSFFGAKANQPTSRLVWSWFDCECHCVASLTYAYPVIGFDRNATFLDVSLLFSSVPPAGAEAWLWRLVSTERRLDWCQSVSQCIVKCLACQTTQLNSMTELSLLNCSSDLEAIATIAINRHRAKQNFWFETQLCNLWLQFCSTTCTSTILLVLYCNHNC